MQPCYSSKYSNNRQKLVIAKHSNHAVSEDKLSREAFNDYFFDYL